MKSASIGSFAEWTVHDELPVTRRAQPTRPPRSCASLLFRGGGWAAAPSDTAQKKAASVVNVDRFMEAGAAEETHGPTRRNGIRRPRAGLRRRVGAVGGGAYFTLYRKQA
jgi:hypothetical protein